MIGGDPHEFLDRIYSCQDTVFIYNGVKYWFQGYMPNEDRVHMEVFPCLPGAGQAIWEYNGPSISEGRDFFMNAPLFNGKTFWEAEKDITWVDD